MSITRRIFVRNGALAVVGTSVIPSFLTRAAFAKSAMPAGKKRLVVLFQRGAADGLNIVVPHGESTYYQLRPTLAGSAPAVAISNINDFGVGGRAAGAMAQGLSNTFESMYAQSVDSVLHGTGQETFDAVKMLKAADPAHYSPAPGANYPRGRFGDSLRQVAQLLKADLGVEAAFADIGGWDHHVNEGSTQGQLASLLREFSQSIAAFWTDIGNSGEDTVLVSMSEFGRTARENGTRGTDHGHANVMFVLGGRVRGGKVYGQWPGLDD